MQIRKINSQDENDISKFMIIRKESVFSDSNHNLMTYPEEEENFSISGYKKYDFLKNYFIAEENADFVAYASYSVVWPRNFQGNHNFMIGPIFVSQDFRNQNIAKNLLENIEKEISKNFSHKNINLLLLVNSENLPAISLYKKCNFEEVGRYTNYIQTKNGKYFDVLIMQKSILNK